MGIQETIDHIKAAVKRRGIKYWSESDMDGGIRWVELKPLDGIDDETIICVLDFYSHYGGPGRQFANDATVRRSKGRVLVSQRVGWDI